MSTAGPRFYGRIEINPAKLAGTPVIRGTRIPVSFILAELASGLSVGRVCRVYEGISREDVVAALRFAVALTDQRNPMVPNECTEEAME